MPLPYCQFPHLFQPGGGFPHLDQFLDLTLELNPLLQTSTKTRQWIVSFEFGFLLQDPSVVCKAMGLCAAVKKEPVKVCTIVVSSCKMRKCVINVGVHCIAI